MPNKTIYIKDGDLEIWEKAQGQFGGSLSPLLTECLRQKLRPPKLTNVEAMDTLISDINASHNLNLELHPFWPKVILDANTLDVGFKIHRRGADPDRIMSLIIDPFNFADVADGDFLPYAKGQMMEAFLEFWGERNTERHKVVRIGHVDVLSRLANLIGKTGLVLTTLGEVEFKILAVHPPASGLLLRRGGDDELQRAITISDFTVQFNEGTTVDGKNVAVVSGFHISLIRGRY
jgi:hypothetical protein